MTPFRFTQLDKKASKAMREGVLKAIKKHQKHGVPLVVLENGKLIRLEAKKAILKLR